MKHYKRDAGERRQYDYGAPPGLEERRTSPRRDLDRTRTIYTTVLDRHMEETVSDEKIEKALSSVMEKIKADEKS